MAKKTIRTLFFLLAGFAGGCISPWFVGWFGEVQVDTASDAISIANTYIIFTTIFFVGVTVIMAALGYVLTHQLAQTRIDHQKEALENISKQLSKDEEPAIAMIDSLLRNEDVLRHVEAQIDQKINEILQERAATTKEDSEKHAKMYAQSQKEIDLLNGLSAK